MSNNNDNEQLSDGDKSLIGLYMLSKLRNGSQHEQIIEKARQLEEIFESQKQIHGISCGDIFENIFRPNNNVNNINETNNIQNDQNNTVQNGEKGDEKKKKKKKHRRKKKNEEQKNDNNIEIQEDKKEEEKKKENDDDKKTIDELLNYINKDNEKEKKKRKHKNKKGKKNEIKTEIHEEEKDEVVEEFKKDITEDTGNSYECDKKKLDDPIRKKIIEMCEVYNEQDKKIKSLDDANEKNNNIAK